MSQGPIAIVDAWFRSFADGDLDAARALFAENGVVHVFADEQACLHGFDAFLAWYEQRRERFGESFDYRVDDLLSGGDHAAALITLIRATGGRRQEWRQVAVYHVVDGLIVEARTYEEASETDGTWARRSGPSGE